MSLSNNNKLYKYFPFLEWISELKEPKILKSDIIAWVTVAFVLIPQSMAYAWLAWLPIHIWLYTAFIPVIIASLFWSSKIMSSWPVTIISLMTATAISNLAISNISTEAYIVYASLIAFFIWIFYILLSILRLWIIVEFLSSPVIIWFTNAVAIITLISQSWKIFWITYDKWEYFFEWVYNLFISIINYTDLNTFLFWGLSILFLFIIWKISQKIPKVLLLIIISTFLSYYLWYTWDIVKNIPNALPSFDLPFLSKYVLNELNLEQIINLFLVSLIIWLIWFTESISVAKFVWLKTKQSINANKELMWQWLSNISSSLFWWYWVAWSFSKTAVNLRAWAQTWFSSVITWIMVLITILYLTPFMYYLPIATLAAIIIVSVSDLIKIKPIIKAYKINKYDWIISVITFIITLFLSPNIELWIIIWISLSLSLFIYKSMRPKLVELWMYKDWLYRDKETLWLKTHNNISIFRFDSELFFANSWFFETKILDLIREKKDIKYVIIDMEWVSNIDSSWIEMLENLISLLEKQNIKIYLTSLRVKVIRIFHEIWFLNNFWKKNIYTKINSALLNIKEKEWDNIDLDVLFEYKPTRKEKNDIEKNLKTLLDKIVSNK